MTQNFSDYVRFECHPHDKEILRMIANRNGGTSMSATLRRLIHDEARRLDIFFQSPAPAPAQQPEPAA